MNEPKKLNPWLFIWRGLRLRCPECGISRMFKPWRQTRTLYDWFNPLDGCPRCGYAYRREPGYFMMAICALNYGLVCAPAIAIAYLVESIWAPPMWMHVTFIFAPMPLLSFLVARHAKSLWVAFDHYCDPHLAEPSPDDLQGAQVREPVHSHSMTFVSPLWLLALIPWAGVALWLLTGRNPRVAVPFIELWRDQDAPRRRAEFRFQLPPIALACLLIAMLLALVAAAKPVLMRGVVPVHILIDHGVTMSGRAPADRPWIATLAEVRASLKSSEVEGDDPASAVNSRDALVQRARELIADRDVVVISNQELGSLEKDSRVARVPIASRANVGIVRVAARELPRASVMVRLRNDSDFKRALIHLAVETAGPVEREIELPSRSGEADYYFDVDRLGNVVSVELIVDDEIRADNRAWLVRERLSPRIEMRTTVAPELARMTDVYARHRPESDRSLSIAIVDAPPRLPPRERGVVVAGGGMPIDTRSPLRVADHPIIAHVRDWETIRDAVVASPPGEGWQTVVRAGDEPLVAVRDDPARQVWVGFSSPTFARSPDFVIFWTDVFDWLGGGGGSAFRTEAVAPLDSSWERDARLSGDPVTADPAPGVYGNANRQLRAMSAIDLKFAPPSELMNWRDKLARLGSHPRVGATTDLSRGLLIAALVFIAAAALCWNRHRGRETPTITEDRHHTVAA